MEVVGSEIGQKMRSAIKAKLTELGCYVDDELPDYVMVMVANKRTRSQMEDDLQLFLGENTLLFVNWLHQVLKKLQEVTVTAPLKQLEQSRNKEKSLSKDKKHKSKKDKQKSKKKKKDKDKEKCHHKKEEKRNHKSKKKSKHREMIRPNIPPLFMNIEKDSEPSITDVFAGQILKNHGVNIDSPNDSLLKITDSKLANIELKRPILPIIDPSSITSEAEQSERVDDISENVEIMQSQDKDTTTEPANAKEEEIKEIEAKIQGLKQKLTEQLDTMSDDEDFLNIRTEAEELMNDFAEDVFQEVSANVPTSPRSKTPVSSPIKPIKPVDIPTSPKEPPELPQIELKLPKRPVRERLGAKEVTQKPKDTIEKATETRTDSPERFTPEREPEIRPNKSAKSRLGDPPEVQTKISVSEEDTSDKSDSSSQRLSSKVSVEGRTRGCASVVRVRPRPRVSAPASSLLLRAVADAQKSLMNIPAKPDHDSQKVKRALVLPMRRTMDPQKIVIQVARKETQRQSNLSQDEVDHKDPKLSSDLDESSEDCAPVHITKKIVNTDYVPPRPSETHLSTSKDNNVTETINIHHQTVDKAKDTQFIVTMDGYHLNALLAKKLLTEGLLDDEDEIGKIKPKTKEKKTTSEDVKTIVEPKEDTKTTQVQSKRLINSSQKSDTHIVLRQDDQKSQTPIQKQNIEYVNSENVVKKEEKLEKRKSTEIVTAKVSEDPPLKKRKASPIVFQVNKDKTEKPEERIRTTSASSDNQVTVTTNLVSPKNLLPLSAVPAAGKPVVWCRTFPLCRFGSACAYAHPRCKFAAACTRRGCLYSHTPLAAAPPVVASHVVPAANYKSISTVGLPTLCKFYPNCVNPACHFYHPKPCRYGKACLNKLECNFYHADVPSNMWKYPA